MNESPKIVISKSLASVKDEGRWKNVTLLRSLDLRYKETGKNIAILGSGSIIQQLTDLNLIDEYELVVVPVILGAGKSLFEGVKKKELKLADAQSFKNGLVSLRYRPSSADLYPCNPWPRITRNLGLSSASRRSFREAVAKTAVGPTR